MTNLAALLRQLRQDRGMTLQGLAQQLELTISYLSDVERGRTVPALGTLERWLGVFDARLGVVYNSIDTMVPGRFPRLLDQYDAASARQGGMRCGKDMQ